MGKGYNTIWVAMYSQTGSELLELIKETGKRPSVILTNTKQGVNPELRSPAHTSVIEGKHDELMDWLCKSYPDDGVRENVVITLHGYLRIIPEEVCNRYRILNGHPGAIDIYPELKGKDPQVRAWENRGNYKFLGSVVHEVVPAVDEGKIIKSVNVTNRAQDLNETYEMLKMTSFVAWKYVLQGLFK